MGQNAYSLENRCLDEGRKQRLRDIISENGGKAELARGRGTMVHKPKTSASEPKKVQSIQADNITGHPFNPIAKDMRLPKPYIFPLHSCKLHLGKSTMRRLFEKWKILSNRRYHLSE